MSMFIPYQSNPNLLLPTRLGDNIPKDDISWVIMEVVGQLDLTKIKFNYSYYGAEAYHPALLLKLIFFGVAKGARSSRKLAEKAAMDLRGMMLCGGLRPSARTISRFIQHNQDEIEDLFVQVLKICISLGMVEFGHFSLDGTKIRACASKSKNRSMKQIEKKLAGLRDEIGKAMAELEANDSAETDEDSPERPPEDLRDQKKREERVEAVMARVGAEIEKEGADLETKRNMTDPESRLMKTSRDGFQQCYNHQIAVDSRERVIVGYTTTQEASDINQLKPVYEESKANTGRTPGRVSADVGYFSGENLAYLKEESVDAYICPEQETGPYHKSKFRYDKERDLYVCPNGRELGYIGNNVKEGGKRVRLYAGDCSECPNQSQCTKARSGNRQVELDEYDPLREEMRAKFETETAKEIYGLRKTLPEPVFGQLKMGQGFDRHLRKGLKPAHAEFGLNCLVHNIKRIWHKYRDCQGTRKATIEKFGMACCPA